MSGTPADAVFIDALGIGEVVAGGGELFGALEGAGALAGAAGAGTGAADAVFAEMAGWDAASGVAADAALAGVETAGMSAWLGGEAAGMGASNFGPAGLSWGDIKPFIGPAMSVGSGLYGMSQAEQMKKMAALAAKRADPWGQSGGRGLADQQLQDLMRDPGQVAQNDPAYKLRMQGAQRATATMGQGSGAMAVAGANASTDWFNQRLAQLGGLAGAGGNPGYAEQIGMQGEAGAADLMSKSLASIGYGVTRGTGGGAAMPPAVLEWFRKQGMA